MAGTEEWSSDANKAVEITLVRTGNNTPTVLNRFHPEFTYPIFGDTETIFGYQGLRIALRFAAHDLRPNVEVLHERKYKTVGDTKALDIKETLAKWLPDITFVPTDEFDAHLQSDSMAKDFKPPGKLLTSYEIKEKRYEVWEGNLIDPAVKELLEHMQIFVPLFIEGGSILRLDDPEWTIQRWKIFLLYEVLPAIPETSASPYSFVGYSTVYRNFFLTPTLPRSLTDKLPPPSLKTKAHLLKNLVSSISPTNLPPPDLPLPPINPNILPSRERISQFLILPPHQGLGHGPRLYAALYQRLSTDPTCHEITVEDPNESFDDLRDLADLTHLRTIPAFTAIRINHEIPIPKRGLIPTAQLLDLPALDAIRTAAKIAPRQFARLTEMQLLSLIPARYLQATRPRQAFDFTDPDDRTYMAWRVLAKQRLYKHNRDSLVQMERRERIDRLEQTLGEVEADYLRLLRKLDARKVGGPAVDDVEVEEVEVLQLNDGAGGVKRKIGEETGAVAEVVVLDSVAPAGAGAGAASTSGTGEGEGEGEPAAKKVRS